MNVRRLLYSSYSKFVISILLGFGLATMFRKVCNDRNCLLFKAPTMTEIENMVYKKNGECYKMTHETVEFDKKKKSVYFA